ncbi:MAG: hypothetical protein LUD18_03420, partial [Lachnospiraceae bacterium]|nr:hypothetical protein [Lachnospiraceae bacterium]
CRIWSLKPQKGHPGGRKMPGMKSEKIIFVYADWMSTEPQLMGRLHVSESRGKEIFSFEYDESWLHQVPH